MKSEGRNSKAERRPKSETRKTNLHGGEWPQRSAENTKEESILCIPCVLSRQPSTFGLRISDFFRPSSFGFRVSRRSRSSAFGFTLIELLIVIAIISILAAMIIPISGAVTRNRIKAKARTEIEHVATAIDLYKAKLGHYPPDNPGLPNINQLYFELVGTTLTNGTYVTLDNSAQIAVSDLQRVFGGGVGGFINTTRSGAGDESRPATTFLNNLKPDETITITNPPPDRIKYLVAGVPSAPGVYDYISYVSSNPTNNPNSYDLWVDIVISGKTNRISNWTTAVVVLP
ncbi:MAG TPA: prepilin-type N-terminal cleavage/methylation domain-containing protein [Verrucomicrobiae bacterium]|nr:prepilin-type N-terminal cleavage/methylation domain-containing protein [Verrucomicrobiae bacterium]